LAVGITDRILAFSTCAPIPTHRMEQYTSKERAKDKRLWKNYRWTLARYNELGDVQEWRCAGCGKHVSEKSLNLDHYHFRIELRRALPSELTYWPEIKWYAFTTIDGQEFKGQGRTQKVAREVLKDQALPFSVRGLLCAGQHGRGCNTKLGRIDDVVWLDKMIKYLNDPPARKLFYNKQIIGGEKRAPIPTQCTESK
jgi:hypothetical protein